MSLRKRPLDAQHGKSPPGKRNRLPGRLDSIRDKYANPKSRSIPSPPSSRKNSLVGLSTITPSSPTATRANSTPSTRDVNGKVIENGRTQAPEALVLRNDVHVASPGSIGSGASTPAQAAPPAPSMLPVSRQGSVSSHSPLQEALPNTMASLRNIKMRKQAIASNAKINSNVPDSSSTSTSNISVLQDQLTAQQSEILQLRKERDEMLVRLKKLETHSNLPKSSSDQWPGASETMDHSRLKDVLEGVKTLNALNLPLKLSELRDEYNHLKALHNETISGADARVNHLQTTKAIEDIVNLENDVESLKRWKEGQSGSVTRDQIRDLVKAETKKNQDKQMEDILRGQQDLQADLGTLQRREENTYTKASDTQKEFEKHKEEARNDIDLLFDKFDKYVGPVREQFEKSGDTIVSRLEKISGIAGQVKTLQGEQLRWSAERNQLLTRIDELFRRVEVIEKDSDQTGIDKTFIETTKNLWSQLKERVDNTEVTSHNHEALTKDIKDLGNQMSDLEQTRLSMHKVFDDKLAEHENRASKRCKELTTDVAELTNRVSGLELHSPANVPEITPLTDPLNSPMSGRLQQIEAEISNLRQNLEQIDTGLHEAEQKVHGHANLIGGLEETVPALFREKFDSLKCILEEELVSVRTEISAEVQQRKDSAIVQEQNNQDVRNQLALKADTIAVRNQFDKFHAIVKNLTDRYDNLSTDSLHQQMVHWFLQTYPSPAANVIHQFSVIQHEFAGLQREVAKVQSLTNQLSWIQAHYPDLVRLLNSSQQLQALLDGTSKMQQLPQTLAKVEEAWDNAKAAVTKSEEAQWKADQSATQTAELKSSLDGLHTSFYNLNANLSSHATIEDLNTLQQNVQGWQALVQENINIIHDTRTVLIGDLKTSTAKEQDERVKGEEQLRKSIYGVKKMTESLQPFVVSIANLEKTVSTLNDSSVQLRKDFDTVNDAYIQPNKEFFSVISVAIIAVKDLQRWVESINQNLDVPLQVEWEIDMNASSAEPNAGT